DRVVLAGSGLHSQFAHPLQVTADDRNTCFGRLRRRNAVVGVTHGDSHAARLGVHLFSNRQTGGVVLGAVDAQAGREALQGDVQGTLRGIQIALSVQRSDVGIDDGGHFSTPWITKLFGKSDLVFVLLRPLEVINGGR